jgi:transcriptional regulator with XRE-family HTH domain
MDKRPQRQDRRVRDSTPAPAAEQPKPAIDPAIYAREDLRRILATLDIGGLYRALKDNPGLSQRQIAQRTEQSQSEVADIVAGRRVENYHLLVRIAEGLNIPLERMGLSWWGPDGTYCGQDTVTEPPEVVSAEMLRRHLLALGATATVGAPIKGLGELLAQLGDPTPVPLPSQLGHRHVVKVQDLTQRLLDVARVHGPDLELSRAAVAWATLLLGVPGPEPVTQALLAAVADLHTIAGAGAFDAGLYEHTMHHYTRALELATEAGDAYLQALALAYAGLATEEHGHPGDGLKMLQLAQVKSWDIPPGHDRRKNVEAVARSHAATALSRLGCPDAAHTESAKARELWQPKNPYGDPDRVAALLELDRGRLDAAEPFAAASVRRWEGGISELGRTHSGIVLATIHVRADEPRGLQLAHSAITAVTKLSSVRAHRRLEPLAAALESRPGSDRRQLARMARRVAATFP